MTEDPDEASAQKSDGTNGWSFADLHDRLDSMADGESSPQPKHIEIPEQAVTDDATLSDLAGYVRDRRPLSDWRWVTIGDRDSDRDEPNSAAELHDLLDETECVLLLGSLDAGTEFDACKPLLHPDDHRATNRLLVTYEAGPDERYTASFDADDGGTGETTIINVGDVARSSRPETTHRPSDAVSIVTLATPRDIARLGMHITRQLSEWEDADEDARTVVCFHSLTALLQSVELDTAFRFLHVLQGRIRGTDAHIHYHMDETAHEEETLATLRPLFDAVLGYGDDGTVTVDDS